MRSISSLSGRRTNCVDTPPHINYSTPKAVDNHDESIGVSNVQPPEEGRIDSIESTDSPSLTGVIPRPLPVTYSLLHRDLAKEQNLEVDRKMNLARYIRTSQWRFLAESFYIDAVRAYNDAPRAVLEPEFEIYLTEILTYLGTSTGRDLPNSLFNWARLWAEFWLELELASLTSLCLASLKGLLRRATEMFQGGQLDASKYRFLKCLRDTWIRLPRGEHRFYLDLAGIVWGCSTVRYIYGDKNENPVPAHVGIEFSTEFRNSEVTLAPLFRQHLIWILVDHCLRLRRLEDWSALLPAIHWAYQALAFLAPGLFKIFIS